MSLDGELRHNERFIYRTTAEEQKEPFLTDGSAFGTYSFGITNTGRVIGFDTGGIFSNVKSMSFEAKRYPLRVSLLSDMVKLTNNYANETFNFVIKLSISDFINIYRSLGEAFFKTQPGTIYIKKDNEYNLLEIELTSEEIILKEMIDGNHKIITIKYSNLYKCEKISPNSLSVQGDTELFSSTATFHIFESVLIDRIMTNHQNSFNITSFLKSGEFFEPVFLSISFNNAKNISTDAFLIYGQNQIRLLRKDNFTVLIERKINESILFLTADKQSIVISFGNAFFFVTPTSYLSKRETRLLFEDISFSNNMNRYITSAGELRGMINGTQYEEPVDIAISSNRFYILSKEKQLLTTGDIADFKFFKEQNMLVIVSNIEIALLTNTNKKLYDNLILSEDEFLYAVDTNDQPYFIDHSNNGLLFYQSKNIESDIQFSNNDISKMKLRTDKKYQLQLLEISNKSFFVPPNLIKTWIYKSYIQIKAPTFRRVSGKSLYTSSVRQIGDYVLYEFFGQIFALYDGLKEFNYLGQADQNKQVVNYLYYGIQTQRKRVEHISIYLPAMLSKFEEELFKNYNVSPPDYTFKNLQKRLLNISGQLNRNLAEIENNLSAISSLLIPMESFDKVIEERRKDGYNTATGIGVATVGLTVLTGGATLPLLLAPGFMALNTKMATDSMGTQEKVRLDNENYRQQFYIEKARDRFNHLFVTMIPYYISQVNEAIYDCYRELAKTYKEVIEDPLIKATLFKRIAELFTYKQLLIDDTVDLNRQELIKRIIETNSSTELHTQSYNQEQIMEESTTEILELLKPEIGVK